MSKLAVIDFDGTIYRGDSMRDFAKFINPGKYYLSLAQLLIPYLQVTFGSASRNSLKAKFLQSNFAGISASDLKVKGDAFFEKYQKRCYPSAINWMKKERANGYQILILSGSCKEWLQPFANAFEAEIVSTELSYDTENKCTGSWKGENLVGPEKLNALKRYLSESGEFEYIIGFGDRKSDLHLKEAVNEFHLNYFH